MTGEGRNENLQTQPEQTNPATISQGIPVRLPVHLGVGAVNAPTYLVDGSTESDWHQHPIGDGWVYKTATVADSAFIWPQSAVFGDAEVFGNAKVYDNALVYGNAQVYGNAKVCGDAKVYGNAKVCGDAEVFGNAKVYDNALVYGNAKVYYNALVYGNAKVYDNAQVYGNAKVCGDAQVFSNAQICDGAWERKPLYIQGSKHHLCHCAPQCVMVGCQIINLLCWRTTYSKVGEAHGYSPRQIEEYARYLALLEATDRDLFPEGWAR